MFYGCRMNWTYAIERHRQPLLGIVAALYAMIGFAGGGTVERLRRPLYRAVLDVLRPAESAVRRLIVVAARGLVAGPPAPRCAAAKPAIPRKGRTRVCFRLFDRRARHHGGGGWASAGGRGTEPHIRVFGSDPRIALFRRPAPAAPEPLRDDSVSAVRLCRRLVAISRALEDLPRQARRYARWRAKPLAERRPKLVAALRPGPPPGLRRKARHEVHAILSECSWLAHTALNPNTS